MSSHSTIKGSRHGDEGRPGPMYNGRMEKASLAGPVAKKETKRQTPHVDASVIATLARALEVRVVNKMHVMGGQAATATATRVVEQRLTLNQARAEKIVEFLEAAILPDLLQLAGKKSLSVEAGERKDFAGRMVENDVRILP